MGVIRDAANVVYADGPTSNPTEPGKPGIRSLFGTVEDEVVVASAGTVRAETWSALSAITGTRNGQPGEVPDQAGTHTDPVAGGTVNNKGIYRWVSSSSAWRRVGDFVDTASLEDQLDAEATARSSEDGRIDAKNNVRLFGVAGTNAITAFSSGTAVTEYTHGQTFLIQPVAANTGAVTLKVGDLDALPLRDQDGNELDAGALVPGRTYTVRTVGSTPISELRIMAGDLALSHRAVTKVLAPIVSTETDAARFTTTAPTMPAPSGYTYVTQAGDQLKFALMPDGSYSVAPLLSALPPETGYALASMDEAGNIGFGVKRDGSLLAKLSDDSVVSPSVLEKNLGTESGYAFAILDGADNIALGVKTDGSVRLRLSEDSEIPPGDYGASVSLPTIACWGDSLTFGSGGSGTDYPSVLASVLGRAVNNGGVSGETSSQILTRQTAASTYYDWTAIIWAGRNNFSDREQVRDDILSMVDNLSPRIKHVMVCSVLNGNYTGERQGGGLYDDIAQLNAELALTFGGGFVDVRRYLIDYGLAEAGITPTPQDTTDVGDDLVPVSLRSDNIHLNAAGYTVVGNYLARCIIARGF